MDDSPVTRPSLLARIRDPDDAAAWRRFVDLYCPLIYRFLRRRGVQDADAADLTQEVCRSVARAAGRLDYDPAKGAFRGWLYTVTRNKLYDFLEKQRRQPVGSGDTTAHRLLEEAPGRDAADETLWGREYERQVFRRAAERVSGDFAGATWQAFWRTAVEGRPGQEVAAELGMSVGAVYVAKSRVMARLLKAIREIQDEATPPGGA
jgi:RNA polymerase sigma-70 factor (ECF subfamily)